MTEFDTTAGAAALDWRTHFLRLADEAERMRAHGETVLLWFAGETSDFVRFNAGRIRQTGRVVQGKLTVRLIDGARQASATSTLAGDLAADLPELAATLRALRDGL
ncbi:TldD/PmbA family protein, partial [Paraburkholderia sp. Se-20369]|nr:TldD/PmbA family protein [Paraburkholderia sp. Se-20369]